MKNTRKIFALMLSVVMLFMFSGCHKQNEVALKVKDVEFTSAYYMTALVNANFEAQNKVYESLSDEEKQSQTSIDYFSKKIDGKKYSEWVKDTAIENLKRTAAYKILCEENKVELLKKVQENATMYASYYWSNYGESQYFEPNGVSFETYSQYLKDNVYLESHFDFVYGKNGEKAISEETVKTEMGKNFVIANVLEAGYEDGMTDAQKTELSNKIKNYEADLKSGKKTFEDVYKDYNGTTEETQTETDDGTSKPKDKYASVLGKEGTAYESEHFETVEKMAVGEIRVIELEDKSGIMLVVKQDILADPYYLETLDSTVRHIIADEEYQKFIDEYVKDLKVTVNKFATNRFKVEKIVIPSGN